MVSDPSLRRRPAYDLIQHMLDDLHRLHADAIGFARRMADSAGVDAEQVERWLLPALRTER